jgi:hypothetical protein
MDDKGYRHIPLKAVIPEGVIGNLDFKTLDPR